MKRVVIITGVTSFLGRNVAKKLIDDGFNVVGIVRKDSSNLDLVKKIKKLKLLEINLENISISEIKKEYVNKEILDRFKKYECTFIHFAWGGNDNRFNYIDHKKNLIYSEKIFQIAKLINAKKFIFAGSQAEITNTTYYGYYKKSFGLYGMANKENMDFIHIRVFSIYGEDENARSIVSKVILANKNNNDMCLGACLKKWNFLYIVDFVNIILLLINNNCKSGIYDIASDREDYLKNFILELNKECGNKINISFDPIEKNSESFPSANIKPLLSVIGNYKFTSWIKGINNTIRFYNNC